MTVEGTLLETFTRDDASYRLGNVPAGSAIVKTFFTGFPVHTQSLPVAPGQIRRHDVDLAATMKSGDPKLSRASRMERDLNRHQLALSNRRTACARCEVEKGFRTKEIRPEPGPSGRRG